VYEVSTDIKQLALSKVIMTVTLARHSRSARSWVPVVTVIALGLALSACGRRGALEAPLTAEQVKAQAERDRIKQQSGRSGAAQPKGQAQAQTSQPKDPDLNDPANPPAGMVVIRETERDEADQFNPSPVGRPAKASRAFTIPKRDFILDPLL
jgi:predicted small lipoprotein YifL